MEQEKEYYTVKVKDLTGKQIYLLETAFGDGAVLSRIEDGVVVRSTQEEVERVAKTYDWISGYESYDLYVRAIISQDSSYRDEDKGKCEDLYMDKKSVDEYTPEEWKWCRALQREYTPPYSTEWHDHLNGHVKCRKCKYAPPEDVPCQNKSCRHGNTGPCRPIPLTRSKVSIYFCESCQPRWQYAPDDKLDP